jgi:hypothetical protein
MYARCVNADDLLDRNRRLLARADAARVWKRRVVEEIAENRLRLHVTLLRTVYLHYGRTGLLSEMIYLRCSIAHEDITRPAGR